MADAEYDPLYLRGIEHFNACDFFEAHEVWEELWANYSGADRTFYQGLIQVAVCLHHFGNGNIAGARKLYFTSRKYLEPYLPQHEGLDLQTLFGELERCCAEFVSADDVPSSAQIDPELIPEIHLDQPGTR